MDMDPISLSTSFVCKYLCGGWLQERKALQEREARLSHLRAEVEENDNIARQPLLAGGLAIARFRLNGWDGVKVDLDKYPEELKTKLHDAYLEMTNFNSLVDEFGRTRDGRIKRVAEIKSREIVEKLSAIKSLIEVL
jgi:hypothetical protein